MCIISDKKISIPKQDKESVVKFKWIIYNNATVVVIVTTSVE